MSKVKISESPNIRKRAMAAQNGFTVVEIILTILVLAIISAVIISRFAGANSFNGIVVRDQIIALTRIAQQSSFGRANVTMTFTPDSSGSDATIVAQGASGVIERVTVPITTLTLTGDINTTDSCGTTAGANVITNASPLVLRFGELGNIVASSGVGTSAGAVQQSVRVCINNNPVMSVCISPIGFAYVGNCDVD